ncbi:SGNH/GDSL hydrolase family protein [Agromyces aerolatus]|uniref:SGNH/GDSL hydrolase family protein n=1 Tax=Agromyces sp. LY-1074 TaxID=3074080 RepID=UPI002854884D|nr:MULTISPECIES: SGNH/GDSL hydrolase family protein [unclassified Agromyces]MDR5698463.1 SGNH/GDSL hydrolase family protein [Agromyces sp. LY-1074]MDR5704757.1 SGNH/GDSL hydrolase family protein [Agromyces sp. LY-1358]
MNTLPPVPAVRLIDGIRHTIATVLGHLGVPRFRAFVAENAATLNDTLPVHSKWWRDRAAAGGDLVYAAIGDSTAQGIGASRPGLSYVGLIAEQIAERTGRAVHVANLSVSGATTALAVRDQLPKFARLDADVVTVSIGANDIAAWDADEFDGNIRTIFAALPRHAIVADVPCFYLPRNERKVAEANRMLRAAAREHGLRVVPLHEHTRRQGLRGILTEFARDMFHPNDAGYRVWAGAFRPAVAARLARIRPERAQRASPTSRTAASREVAAGGRRAAA